MFYSMEVDVMARTSEPGTSVTERVLRVLEAFRADRRQMTLSEIAYWSGLPLSTAHRLVGELVAWRALERDEADRYQIGLRLWETAALSPRSAGLREIALPFLEDLYEATHENVQLAVLDGTEAVYVERLCGRDTVRAISRVGGRLPLHATGVGLVLLAYSDHEFQERVLAGPLRRFGPRTITSPSHLRQILAQVRREKVAVSDRQIEMETLSVAAPIFGPSDRVLAALSIVIPARYSPSAYLPAVRTAARGVSRAIGGSATVLCVNSALRAYEEQE